MSKKYIIVSAAWPEALQAEVNEHISYGYIPAGGLAAVIDGGVVKLYQAMVSAVSIDTPPDGNPIDIDESADKPDLRFACYPPSDPANPIDWAQAPEWANWATYRRSSDYWIYWYAKKPKEDGTWAEGAHSREFHNAEDQIVIEQRPS